MKEIFSLVVITLCLISLGSCSSYISNMHREFDRADGTSAPKRSKPNFDLYRERKPLANGPVVNSRNNPYVIPSVKRAYTNPKVKPRIKARDIADSRGDGSLWSGLEGRNNYLFTEDTKKSHGDIVLIKVAGKMKNQITAELKRAFPAPAPVKSDKEKPDAAKAAAAPAAPPAPAADDKVDDSAGKVYDRVSSVVVEEINEDHILLRGRKSVLYKNRKRLVEIQALVSRKDILADDTVISDSIIENNITILR